MTPDTRSYKIAIVADVDSATMGPNFRNISKASLQAMRDQCERSFVLGDASKLVNLKSVSTNPPFKGVIDVLPSGIAKPNDVRDKIVAALEKLATEDINHLAFREWTGSFFVTPEADLKCFRIIYEGGKWVVVYNAHLILAKGDVEFASPMGLAKFVGGTDEEIILKSHWLATLSHPLN